MRFLGETANLISELMNYPIKIESQNERKRPKNSEVDRLYGCNKKIRKLTNWNPKFLGLEGFKNI